MTDPNRPLILVTGACGWIGRTLCQYLRDHEHAEVVAMDLREADGPWDHFVELDISKESGLPALSALTPFLARLRDSVVIHAAGYAHRPVETPEEVAKFDNINAKGTQRVVSWAKTLGILRMVYLSSIAFYDWAALADGEPATEDSPLSGKTAYAKSKLAGEKAVRNSGLDSRVLRLATVYGEGDQANFAKLARALKRGRFALPGDGSARKSVISVDKAAEWIGRYALMGNVPYPVLNLGFAEAPTLRQICEAYSKQCGFPHPKRIPEPLLRVGSHVGDGIARVWPGFPLTSATVEKLSRSTQVDCSRAVELFPEGKDLSFAGGLRAAIRYYKEL